MQSFPNWVPHRVLNKLLFLGFLVGYCVIDVLAQSSEALISVTSHEPPRVRIELSTKAVRHWSFRNSYGRIIDLSNRIENIRGTNAEGRDVPLLREAPGEFRSETDVVRVSYEVSLTAPADFRDRSHVSWLDSEKGLFMLGDLLPLQKTEIDLVLNLPNGWSKVSRTRPDSRGRYKVVAPDKAVLAIGKSLRHTSERSGVNEVTLATTGDWPFKDKDSFKVVEKITAEIAKILQRQPPAGAALLLIPMPEANSDQWTAETRGSSVVLLMGTKGSRSAALSRLKVVLAHELFHLWVPNALALSGDYDWFFEGFTLYQALLTGLRLRFIKFEDYLETLGRVYDSYRSSTERDRLSLLEASERRWTTTTPLVYDKGMLVAFIYDLMLRQNSANRAIMSDLYPDLFRTAGDPADGSNVLMDILDRRSGMQGFSERFVKSSSDIDLGIILKPFGLEVVSDGARSRIQVSKVINREQRQLLKTLGHR